MLVLKARTVPSGKQARLYEVKKDWFLFQIVETAITANLSRVIIVRYRLWPFEVYGNNNFVRLLSATYHHRSTVGVDRFL